MNTRPLRTRPIGPTYHGIEEVDDAEIIDEPEDELWHVQVAAGDVRKVSIDKLDDLYRYDAIDENVFVWKTGMTEWVQLSKLLGVDEPEPDETFHVLLGPNNVKQLSLELLDDYYRLDVINEDTLVWQKGMSGWKTLASVAGLDEPAAVELPTTPHHEMATQPFAANSMTARPPATQSHVATSMTARPPATQSYTAQSSALQTARPPATRSPAAQSSALQTTRPPATQSPAANALRLVPTQAAPIPSAPPVAFSIEPMAAPIPRSRTAKWGVRLALAAGVLLAVLRNDAVPSLFDKTSVATRYAALEADVIGGPAFGTPRSVDRLVSECGGHLEPVRLPVAVSQFADTQKTVLARTQPEPTSPSATRPSSASQPTASATAGVAAASNGSGTPSAKAGEPPAAKANGSQALTQNVAAALGGMPIKPTATAPKASAAARPAKKRATTSKGSLKGGGSYFDPLNPTL